MIYCGFKFRVRIERVSSAAALSQHLQHQVLAKQEGRRDIELETLTSQVQTGTNTSEVKNTDCSGKKNT